MTGRHATMLVCDDCLFSLNGKISLHGIYTTDIAIATDALQASQLMAFFIVEGDLSDIPESMALEVKLPGSEPTRIDVPMNPQNLVSAAPERQKWFARIPVPLYGPVLRIGKIEAKVIFNDGELLIAPHWISVMPKPVAQSNP